MDTLGLFVARNLHFCEWAQTRPHGSASGVLLLRSTCFPIKLKISHKVEDFVLFQLHVIWVRKQQKINLSFQHSHHFK